MVVQSQLITHTLSPIYSETSRILLLGSLPSPTSRSKGFYFAHPQNRFWRVISEILEVDVPLTDFDKTQLLLEKNIALWDVIESCNIKNADDSSITDVKANDFREIFSVAKIDAVFTIGKKSTSLYNKYCKSFGFEPICLPSTSPANCATSYEKLVSEFAAIKKFL